ncbi:MAG: hypothetical protein HYY40_08625 [Bacteroidetes bacterium]|nr:hypothetical protein [Bacteroidota bacterium]
MKKKANLTWDFRYFFAFLSFALFLVVYFMVTSCRKESVLPRWEADLLFPLAKTTLSADDIVRNIDDSLLQVSSGNTLSLSYSGLLFRLEIDTLLDLPDTTVKNEFTFFFPVNNIPPGTIIYTGSTQQRYNLGEVQLTEIVVRYGWIEVEMSTTVDASVIMKYEVLNAFHDTTPLKITEYIPQNTLFKKSYFIGDSADNRGYRIPLTGSTGIGYNTVSTRFDVITDPAGAPVNIIGGDKVTITARFLSVIPEFVKGYFGTGTFQADSVIATNSFGNILGGTVDIDSIDINLEIRNGLGADMQFDLNGFTSVNDKTGISVSLAHPVISNPVNLTRAVHYGPEYPPVTPFIYRINMSTSNSNIDQLLENIPRSVGYDFSFSLNPYGNNSLGNDFFYYSSPVEVYLNATAPLGISADNFMLADTVDFSFGNSDTSLENHLVSGLLKLYAWNGFPISAAPQLFLMDTLFTVLDSLIIPQGTIEAGITGTDNKVISKSFSVITIPVSKDKLKRMREARKMMIRVAFSTPPGGYLKIYSDYEIELKLVADVRAVTG